MEPRRLEPWSKKVHAEIERREREFLVAMLEYAEPREGDPTFETKASELAESLGMQLVPR